MTAEQNSTLPHSLFKLCSISFTVALLSGCGKAPVDFGPTTPTPTAATLTFRAIEGSVSAPQSVMVSIHNDDALSAYTTNGKSFSIAAPASCAQGASLCQITVVFDPKSSGLETDILNLKDQHTGVTSTVSLVGTTYVAPVISPGVVDFGNQQVGTGSLTYLLSATGQQQDQLTVSVQPSGIFKVANGATCAQGYSSCPITITFNPANAGPASGSLMVTDVASGLVGTISLNGNGVLYPSAPMAGLDYYLPFADKSGTVVRDLSGNGRNGTISGDGTQAIWVGEVGLQPNDQIVTIPDSGGRPLRGVCAYFPAATNAGFSIYDYLQSSNIGPTVGQALESSYGPSDQGHGTAADFPVVAITAGSTASFTQSLDGYSGIHCIEETVGTSSSDPDHIVVDGREVTYLNQSYSPFELNPVQLANSMTVQQDVNGTFANPPVIYSVWGAGTADTVAKAQMRTSYELGRLASLDVAVIPAAGSAIDSTCSITGTSIDTGYFSSHTPNDPPSDHLDLDYPCTVTNFAIGGQAPKDMEATVQDREQTIVHPRAQKNIGYHGGVTNGVVNYQEKPENALQDMLDWNTKMHALGYKTIASTMISRCGNAGYHGMSGDELKQAFNALLLANADSFDWVANQAAAPQLGADDACSNSAYFVDAATGFGTHPNHAGQAYYIAAMRTAFEGVYPRAFTLVSGNYTQMPSDTNIVVSGSEPYTVTLMDANTANFNAKGIVCVNNLTQSSLTLAAITSQTVLGSGTIQIASGATLCVRSNVADPVIAGAEWINAYQETLRK